MPLSSPETAALRFDQYRAAVCRAVVPLDVRSQQADSFRGRLSAGGSGDIHVLGIGADPHTVSRTPRLIARGDHRYFKFTVMESGSGLVVQDGRETALGVGDMTIYDTSRPYSLLLDTQVRMSVVMFPHEILGLPMAALASLTATRLGGHEALRAMTRSCLAAAAEQLPDVSATVSRHLCRGAMELVEAVLESCVAASATEPRSTLLRRVMDYIDENVTSQDLSPARIASAHFISLRTLHGLFSAQGTTVSTVIRMRRLERCYDAVLAPRNSGLPVSTIALSHGFTDAAHFSRAFRAQYGVSPSSLRKPGGAGVPLPQP